MTGLEAAQSLLCDLDAVHPIVKSLVDNGEVYWPAESNEALKAQIGHLYAALELIEPVS